MINFVGIRKEYEEVRKEIDESIRKVINNARFILGEEVVKFENEFAEYCGKRYGIGVGNGTDALTLALRACGVGQGDEVITVNNTSPFTILGILNAGADAKLVDCGKDYLIDSDKIEEAVTEKTKIIMPVHLYGNVCDMNKILDIAKKWKLVVVEDCAQAAGAAYKGKKVPVSDVGCFSFYETKNLGAYGDAGMVVTDNKEIYEKIRMLRNGGQKVRDDVQLIGINSRIDEIQAAILSTKLKHLDKWNEKRRENANKYNELLRDIREIKCPEFEDGSVCHLYVIRAKDRDKLREYLKEKEIASLIHYPVPNNLQPAFKKFNEKELSISEKLCKEILSLPIFPQLKREEIVEICKAIKDFYKKN